MRLLRLLAAVAADVHLLCHGSERVCIRNTVESQFFKPPREMKIGLDNQIVPEIGCKITGFDWGGK